MSPILSYLLLFFAGMVAGFINVNAGGGSSLTLPVLIFMGLPGAVANGTNRIGILVQTFSAVSSFKNEKVSDFKRSLNLALLTLPGAVAGALLSITIPDTWFRKILGLIMIGIVLSMILKPRPNRSHQHTEKGEKNWLIYPAMIGIGFYGGFIQVGVGFLLMAALYHLIKLTLIRVNMHKVFIVFIYTIPAILIFILSGNVNWPMGITLALGSSLGAWWGVKLAVRGGEKIIRLVLIGAILIMSFKLLGLF